MCGIVGVLGEHEAAPLLVEALKRLEYRGYDSAGIATVDDSGRLDRRRAVGKLVNLSDLLVHQPLTGRAGIGHTRWATHGAATRDNAHPHRAGPVAVVHNGIIENFRVLRDDLTARGLPPESDTDTEVVALLTRAHLEAGASPEQAVAQTLARLEGAFALLFLFEGEPDLMIAARQGSPLAIGHGEGEMFVGSDAIALAPMTDRITYLEEGDRAIISRAGARILNADGREVRREMREVRLDAAQVGKAGYKHFMAKEIAEQPAVLGDLLAAYSPGDEVNLPLQGIDFNDVSRISITACGTAYLAGLTAKYWFEQIARLPVDVDVASEYRYREPPVPAGTLAIFVSQSGETADTLAALRYTRAQGARIVSLVNVEESSIARESDIALPIRAGVEVSVASTKAFTSQLTVFALMALMAARARGQIDAAKLATRLDDLRRLPGLISHVLGLDHAIRSVADDLKTARDVLFLGRGQLYPLALEGALKLKEISYIHAEGYPAGELKHGPIALIDAATPTVVLAPRDALFDKTVSNMHEVMARGGRVLLISDAAPDGAWRHIAMPEAPALLHPVLYALPVQMLAYHTAIALGTDVDQPRNLAKSVTVE